MGENPYIEFWWGYWEASTCKNESNVGE